MERIIEVMSKKTDLISGEPVSKEKIAEAEKMLNVKFAKDYTAYVERYGFVCYDSHEITGIGRAKRLNVVDVTLKERDYVENLPDGAYVIEQAHIDGIVIWQVENGKIYQSHGNGSIICICDNLTEYVNK